MKGIKKIWSEQELASLTTKFPFICNKCLAKEFNCGWRTIIRKARELNLQKSESFRDSIDFSSFGKGNEPWNKGLKGLQMVPKCVEKQFKKGHVPATKNNPELIKKLQTKRNETIKKEKLRIKYTLPQKTKLKLVNY